LLLRPALLPVWLQALLFAPLKRKTKFLNGSRSQQTLIRVEPQCPERLRLAAVSLKLALRRQ
jgi:hypothetical protein